MQLDPITPEEDISVTRFRQYLRIETVQPTPDYESSKKFLQSYAEEMNFPFTTIETKPGKYVHIMTVEGSDKNLKSILLNSHIDVVPVYPEYWTHPPFSAHKDENGDIWARGSQDMKLVGIQYVEAIRRLRQRDPNWQPKRTLHITWVPDEEIGGIDGLKEWLHNPNLRPSFDALNAGFELDEGLATPDNVYKVYYGERTPWWIKIIATGQPGHASQFIPNTAGQKLAKFINKVLNFREIEETKMNTTENFTLGDVTSVNFTMCEGGVQQNVVPAEMSGTFDFRVTPRFNVYEFKKMIETWAEEIGDIQIVYQGENYFQECTDLENEYVGVLKQCFQELDMQVTYEIFPAATDARYLREVGIPSIGFSPMIHEEVLLHDHNERLNEKTFLRGVEIYTVIIDRLANF